MDSDKTLPVWAVLTGDIVGSSHISPAGRGELRRLMLDSFQFVSSLFASAPAFQIFRGDSFQAVLDDPQPALRAVICIRAFLLSHSKARRFLRVDVRIAIGIGAIDYRPPDAPSAGDGEAYRRSGWALDGMRKEQRLVVRTPWPAVDGELAAECALLDALSRNWSAAQCRAILDLLMGLKQSEAAARLGITQPAIAGHRKKAGAWAVEQLLQRYQELIDQYLPLEATRRPSG